MHIESRVVVGAVALMCESAAPAEQGVLWLVAGRVPTGSDYPYRGTINFAPVLLLLPKTLYGYIVTCDIAWVKGKADV